MDFSVTQQSTSFLFFCLLGFLTGIFYDFAKALRILLKADKKTTALIDVAFLICIFIFYLKILFQYNGLGIHIFQLLGAFLGLMLYFSTVSSFFEGVFKIILTILSKILKILLYPLTFLCRIVGGIVQILKKQVGRLFSRILNTGKKAAIHFKKFKKRRKKV